MTGFTITMDKGSKEMIYNVQFKRITLGDEKKDLDRLESILQRPWSDEVEDYKEYKVLRRAAREKESAGIAGPRSNDPTPALALGSDGVMDVGEDEIPESRRRSSVERVHDLPRMGKRLSAIEEQRDSAIG